jgi:thiol-disulfide isomerase/thioredoxin
LVPLALIVLLRFTGLMDVVSQISGSLLLKTGILNASTEAPAVMHPFPYDFALQDLSGHTIDVSRLRGKILFINVWATRCGPCRIEMPSIEALYKDTDTSRVAFLMISVDKANDLQKVATFVSEKGFSFPVYRSPDTLPELLRVNAIPTTFIVSRDGKVIVRESGLANYNTKAVRALLDVP